MTKPTGRPDLRGGDARKLRDLETQIAGLNRAYQGSCNTIAAMHAAAVGEVRQPIRGLVEDIHDVRKAASEEIGRLADLVSSLSYQRATLNLQLMESTLYYEKRVTQLVQALFDAKVPIPDAPSPEAQESEC